MVEVLRGDPHEVVIRVSGGLAEGEDAALARCLAGLRQVDRLVLDFSRAHALADAAVGVIARQLAGRGGVRVRGLGRHHLRLLRYCGVHEAAGQPLGGDRDG